MLKIKQQTSIMLMLCLLTGIAFAAKPLPKHYPASFQITGIITHIYKKRKIIELDKADYKLHPIHDIYGKRKLSKLSLYNLKPGMKIGAKLGKFKGKWMIQKIWVLPKDYQTKPHAF